MATADPQCYCPLCGKKGNIYFFDWILLPNFKLKERWAEACGACVAVKERRFDEFMSYYVCLRNRPRVSSEDWWVNYIKSHKDYVGDENRIVRTKKQKL
jgi:hypothetical protein